MKSKIFFRKIARDFQKAAKKIWQKKTGRKIIIGAGIFLLVLAVFFSSFNLAYWDKIFPRTFIGEINFGGKTRDEADKMLKNLILKNADSQLSYSWQEKSYTASLSDLEVDYQSQENQTLDELMAVGRLGSLEKILKEHLKAIFTRNDLVSYFKINEGKLNDYLMVIAQDVDQSEKDATIEIKDGNPEVIKEEIGQKFEVFENRQIAFQSIGKFTLTQNLPFKISQILPKIDRATAEQALPETRRLLGRQLVLKAENKTFQINPEDMPELLEFVARLDKKNVYFLSPEISATKVYERVQKIAGEIYQEPKDPKFEVSGGRVKAFQLAQTGYELDKDQATSQIIAALKADQTSLDLPIKVTESKIGSNDPAEIGLKELVGEGTTNFSGSPENRRHNIAVGAKSFDGILIKPGEEFSMLKYLGPVESSTGYLPELVIKEDRTIPEYGGGLCQVSTTMFRAALNTGLKITERQNHSYRVRYYEPPVGMDATVYIPKPDLRFVNDYDSYLLIQTEVSGDNLTFKFYGTKDGRRSETTDPYVYDVIGAGEPIYTESPDLAPGEIKRIETAHPGSKASFTYRVYDAAGKLRNEQTFQSAYVPWPARYLYGPGTTIPPVEE